MTEGSRSRDSRVFVARVEVFAEGLARHRERAARLLAPGMERSTDPEVLRAALEELRFHRDAAAAAESELRKQLTVMTRLESERQRFAATLRDREVQLVREWREREPTQPARDAQTLNGIHVLVVDGEIESRELMVMVLRRAAATVQWASSATQALAICAPGAFDVIVSELSMPDLDGHELLRQLRLVDPGLAALAVSADIMHESGEQALAGGFELQLAKPLDTVAFIEAVYEAAQLRGL